MMFSENRVDYPKSRVFGESQSICTFAVDYEILVSAPVPLGLIGSMNKLGLDLGRAFGVFGLGIWI